MKQDRVRQDLTPDEMTAIVLARIETLRPGSFQNFLERRFRKVARKTVVKAWEVARAI